MLEKVLNTPLREKSGADTNNRYQYQDDWILLYIIDRFDNQHNFLVICDFHDDMLSFDHATEPSSFESFQIKTKIKNNFRYSELFLSNKRRSEKKEHSILGLLFLNFLNLGVACNSCYLVVNQEVDRVVMEWQEIIKDNKILAHEKPDTFNKIRTSLRDEFMELSDEEFEMLIPKFIQNTFVKHTELPLVGHDNYVRGEFFTVASKFNINISNCYRVFLDVKNDIRTKSARVVSTPISFTELVERKGVSYQIFEQIKDNFGSFSSFNYEEYKNTLLSMGLSRMRVNQLVKMLRKHHAKRLNPADSHYQTILSDFIDECNKLVKQNYDNIDDIKFLQKVVRPLIERCSEEVEREDLDKILLEAVFYETLLSE